MNPVQDKKPRIGPNGRPVRYFEMPDTFTGKLRVWRYIIYRRIVQITILVLFFGTFHWGWTLLGAPLLEGNLSASEVAGVVPLADPFAVLQILLTRHWLSTQVLLGAVIVLAFYTLVGGRTWCAWACPVNMVTDLANWLRTRFGIANQINVRRNVRYAVLGLALLLSALSGVAAFEWVSPISMLHRGLIFGMGLGWTAIVGIFLLDLLVLKHGWCGHFCPLGAFYAVPGRLAQVRISYDTPTCTHCGECVRVCPEPQVLNFKKAAENGMVASGECTNCGRCITVCPEDTLKFDLRARIRSLPRRSTPSAIQSTEENVS